MRTTATPLGPALNAASAAGVVDQTLPLVGYDVLPADTTFGYWPLFATTRSDLEVDKSTAYWIKAYDASGNPLSSVQCKIGEAIIGVKYGSHIQAAMNTAQSNLNPIPDIQCAQLKQSTTVNILDATSVSSANVTNNGDGTATVSSAQSVMDIKQCMIKKVDYFGVKQQTTVLNTCYGRQVKTKSKANVLLIEYLLSLKPVDQEPRRRNHYRGIPGPQILEFLIDPVSNSSSTDYSADSLFGSDNSTQDLLTKMQTDKDNAEAKAIAQYTANFGSPPPSVDQINAQLGPTPWDSDKLIANSGEFASGSLMNGDNISIVRGFRISQDPSNPIEIICGYVYGCAHGQCTDTKCRCDPGWSGASCSDKLDPCGEKPCGPYGTCVPNFGNSSSTTTTTTTNNSSAASSGNNYLCTCNEGWSGTNCDISKDVCIAKLDGGFFGQRDCGHGSCVADNTTSAGFVCTCDLNWKQADVKNFTSPCNTSVTDCVGKWTQSQCDSSCMLTETYAILIQPSGPEAAACNFTDGQTRQAPCTGGSCKSCGSRDCNGRGKCDSGTGLCVCESGWNGGNCELATDACSTSLCNGHGNCNTDKTSCTCMNGWMSDSGTSVTKFCTIDPCIGCPEGSCNTDTGYCSCSGDSDPKQYPACLRAFSMDCQGQWSDWGQCTPDCQKKKYYNIISPAGPGGKMCPNKLGDIQTAPCTAGLCCKLDGTKCQNKSMFIAASCECRCPVGYQGQYCETASTSADRVLVQEQTVDSSQLGALNTTTRAPITVPTVLAQTQATESTEPATDLTWVYVGAGVGGAVILGVIVYFMMKKPKPPPADPLLAGVEGLEGLEGMDLTNMDLSALGMDPNQPAPPSTL